MRDSRKRQGKRRETCETPANAKVNAGKLAGVPANVKANAGRPAGVPANAKANAGRLAGEPANAKANAGRLAGVPANAPKVFRGTCNSVVGISKNVLALAWLPQKFSAYTELTLRKRSSR